MVRTIALLAAAAVLLAGCFGGSAHHAPPPLRPAPAADVLLIRAWSNLLDGGLVDEAANLFTVPAVAQNGGRPRRLTTYREVRSFNASLPCGAKLARAYVRGRYVVAVFALTDRPGRSCGVDYGHEAATELLIRGGRIAEWRSLDEPLPDAPVGE